MARAILQELERRALVRALERDGFAGARVLAPRELAPLLPHAVPYARAFEAGDNLPFEAAILRLDRLGDVDWRVIARIRNAWRCSYINASYALFVAPTEPEVVLKADATARHPTTTPRAAGARVRELLARLETICEPSNRGFAHHWPAPPAPRPITPSLPVSALGKRAALVTTFNRPGSLQRTLPQITRLGVPVLVVDDGSESDARAANREICAAHGAAYVALPENRGLPTALNVGLSYLLANPDLEWISYFQDDVDVAADLLATMALLEDPAERPILTGYDAEEHPAADVVEIAGRRVKLKRSSPAVHVHAHATYWAGIMPIPSPYLGAPKALQGASMEDWWIVSQAPGAAEPRGIRVVCVPGLVRTFLWHRDDSTWDNPREPEPSTP